jgi:hypothetical protein
MAIHRRVRQPSRKIVAHICGWAAGFLVSGLLLLVTPAMAQAAGEPMNWGSIADWTAAGIMGALMLIALFQLIYFIKQLRVMEKTIDNSLNAQAPALVAQVTVAGLTDPVGEQRNEVVRPVVNWRMENHGETPAVIRRFQDRQRWMHQLPPEPDFDGQELSERDLTDYVVARGNAPVTFTCRLPHNISKAEWDNPGEKKLHLFGRVEYDDLFGRKFVQGFALRITRIAVDAIRAESTGGPKYNYRLQK